MNFADLKTELAARGFDYLSTTRQGYFLNRSYTELCEEEDWPFLEATSTGAMPLTITDLRTIESVIDSTATYKLRPLDRRNITDTETDLTQTGTPLYYYTSTTTTVNVYPANTTDSFSVRYWKVPVELSADGDIPAIPTRFHQVIVDGACMYAYFDSDNFEGAQALAGLWAEGKQRMRDALLNQQHDEPDDLIVSRADHADGGGW